MWPAAGADAGSSSTGPDIRIDQRTSVAYLEMHVGKLCLPRQPDQAELLPCRHLLARLDHDAAAAHMAIYGLPATAVIDDSRIAARPALDRRITDLSEADIGHVVADPPHAAGRGGEHRDAFAHRPEIWNADIGAGVAVVRARSAEQVLGAGPGIVVDVVLHEAGFAEHAVDRLGEADFARRRRGRARQQPHDHIRQTETDQTGPTSRDSESHIWNWTNKYDTIYL